MRAKVTKDGFKCPDSGRKMKSGEIIDGREARHAVNAGAAERYSAKQRLKDAQVMILSGGKLSTGGKV